jgi:hypothetical protein
MEDRQEYVYECLLLRTETLKEIAEGAKVGMRTVSHVVNSKDREMNTRTLNKLYNYFQGRKK